ncbi:hypothetical protein F5B17DRAFT_449353 [Nemania serpens]|nr:hypothetical protein F5B17DRAFT_449353 [Nemania serpens]
MASTTNWRSNAGQPPRQRAPANRGPIPHWQVGDIAFFKPAEEFSQAESAELLETGRVCAKATRHPVIILASSQDSQHYIITTVSAYASDEYNNYLPPWKQGAHRRKDINGFRAFEGSVKPNNNYGHLYLADNQLWPKVKTSWVYIHNPCLVPASTLIRYNKPGSQLRMTPESLQDLTSHMDAKSWSFRKQKMDLKAMTELRESAKRQTEQPWRQQDKEYVSKTVPLGVKFTNIIDRSRPPSHGEIAHAAPKPSMKTYAQITGHENVRITVSGIKPSWAAVAARSTSIVKSMTCQPPTAMASQLGSWN